VWDDSGYLSVYRRVTCLTIMGGNEVFEHAQRKSHTLKKEGHLSMHEGGYVSVTIVSGDRVFKHAWRGSHI